MKHICQCLVAITLLVSTVHAQSVKLNIPYAEPVNERQKNDIYTPQGATNLPVVIWIHGGGWQAGDRTSVENKPKAFNDKGFIFISTGYRLWPTVDMETLIRDVAKSVGWVHKHISEYGGDPNRLLIMGHSAGAQLAAILCTDHRFLQAEGVSLAKIKACVPVDGDTYDIPAIITTAEIRRLAHGEPARKNGHREKFGNDPEKHVDFSAVTHVAPSKGIPPFFILHVSNHPDTTAQAQRFGNVLKGAGIGTRIFGVKETTHNKINADLGLVDDSATQAMFEWIADALK